MQPVAFDDDGAKRIVNAVKAHELGNPQPTGSQPSTVSSGQLQPFYILAGTNENGPTGFPLREVDGFDWSELDASCGDGIDLVDASSSSLASSAYTLRDAFFEGSLFPHELGQVFDYGNVKYLFGGSHLQVVGTLDTSTMRITLDDCGTNWVEAQWLTQPDGDITSGLAAVAVYCRNIRRYVVVAYDACGDA